MSVDLRLSAAIVAGRGTGVVIRRLGRGGGTAAPGVVANLIDPDVLDKLARRVPGGCVVIAGTNGKTTTARLLAGILARAGRSVVHNRAGSNLVRGVTAALADRASLAGLARDDLAVLESDEAAFSEIVRRSRPRLIVLLDLFRDQLDRYGELDTIGRRWEDTLRELGNDVTVLVNADDPALAALSEGIPARRLTFGFAEERYVLAGLPHAADSTTCRRCGASLQYAALYLSHLGNYACPGCGYTRPALDFALHALELRGIDSIGATIDTPSGRLPLHVALPGVYNAYNALAAAAAALHLGVPPQEVQEGLAASQAAFGRIERVDYRGRHLVIVLVKNPTGFNEVLRMLAAGGLANPTLILINDLAADGRDVSWLWDVDVESLASEPAPLATGGIRGEDMAVRLKYAGVDERRIRVLGDVPDALESFVESLDPGGAGYILPTYTAMLRLRELLTARGVMRPFWQQ